jgi:hypothetical protein
LNIDEILKYDILDLKLLKCGVGERLGTSVGPDAKNCVKRMKERKEYRGKKRNKGRLTGLVTS